MSLPTLPQEILLQVVSYLADPTDIHSLRKTTHQLYHRLELAFYRALALSPSATSALIFAAARCNKRMLQEVLEHGPCLTIKKELNPNRNIQIVPNSCSNDVLNQIIGLGANLIIHTRKHRNVAFTGPAVVYATKIGDSGLVRVLVEKGADISAWASDGRNALHYAAALGHVKIIKVLLQKGASRVAQAGEFGEVAVDLALGGGGSRDVVGLLRVARVTSRDGDGGGGSSQIRRRVAAS